MVFLSYDLYGRVGGTWGPSRKQYSHSPEVIVLVGETSVNELFISRRETQRTAGRTES